MKPVDGKYLTLRKLPTWRLIIMMGLSFGAILTLISIPDFVSSDNASSIPSWVFAPMIFAAGVSMLIPVLILWRLIIIISEAVYGAMHPAELIEYVNEDAIKVIKQNLTDPTLQSLTEHQINQYITEASSDSNMSYGRTGRYLNNSKLKKCLDQLGIVLSDKQLAELQDAESIYMKNIGIMK